MARIEYRVCDLTDKHANPVTATYVVDDGDGEHDVCDVHVTTMVTAGILNGAEYITLSKIGAGVTQRVKPPSDQSARQRNFMKTYKPRPSDEPCIVCGRDDIPTEQGLRTHQRRIHQLRGGKAVIWAWENPHQKFIKWKERKVSEDV